MLEGKAGRRSSTTQYQLQEELSITNPTEEPSLEKNHQLQVPAEKDVHCISYKKSTNSATQAMKNHPTLLLFSNGLLFKTTPPNFLFLHKIMFLSFVRFAYGFAILCYSQINLFLLVK